MTTDKKLLFVTGAPRSGTSALGEILNLHPQVFLGTERYLYRARDSLTLTEELYEADRFFAFEDGDTWYKDAGLLESLMPRIHKRERYANATHVGDKLPLMHKSYAHIAAWRHEVTIILIMRNIFDVAASYNQRFVDSQQPMWVLDYRDAVSAWNGEIDAALKYKDRLNIMFVSFEDIFEGCANVNSLISRLGLTELPQESLGTYLKNIPSFRSDKTCFLSDKEKVWILENANVAAYREALSFTDR